MKIEKVSWCLGHKNIQTTWNTYLHQLKADGHAQEALKAQHARFPGIPHAAPEPILIEASDLVKIGR